MDFSNFLRDFWGVFLAFIFAATVFGVGYNTFVGWLHRHGYNEGYTWAEVIIGVAGTLLLLGGLLLATGQSLLPVLLAFALFAASGLPMAAGDIWRYAQARREHEDA